MITSCFKGWADLVCARYIPDGYKSKVGVWWGGGTPTLSLCLTWISILCGINRCFKAKKKRCWLYFWIFQRLSLPHWGWRRFVLGFFFSFSFWCELHSGQRSICRCPRISLLKTPLSAVGMSCKVQAKSSSQWECNSLLGDAHLPFCTPSFSSPSRVRDDGDNLFPFLVYIMQAHADL